MNISQEDQELYRQWRCPLLAESVESAVGRPTPSFPEHLNVRSMANYVGQRDRRDVGFQEAEKDTLNGRD